MTRAGRTPVFYGWWVVGACLLVQLYTSGTIYFGFTAVFVPIANEFGWSYAQISLAASLRGVETGLLAPMTGILVDRWGPRWLIFGGAVITGLGLILLSRINSLGMFYAASLLIAVGMSTTGSTVTMTAVANWFQRRVALATGIMTCGAGLGGLLVPLVAALTDRFEWRMAMLILGLGTWAVVLPLSLLIRHKPEQYGYQVDGDKAAVTAVGSGPAPVAETGISLRQSLSRRVFWHIALAALCQGVAVNALVVHVMPYLNSIGVARSAASLVASGLPVMSILGRLGFGWFGDRLDKRRAAAFGYGLMAVAVLLFGKAATGLWVLAPFLLLFGIGWGGNVTMRAALVREHFGRRRFGSVHGFVMGGMTLGEISGPPLAGWIFDRWGSYDSSWLIVAAFLAVAAFAVFTIPQLATRRVDG